MKRKICVIGLGYVGLPLARLFSTKFETVGFDMNQARVDALMAGHDATFEVSDELLQDAIIMQCNLSCTQHIINKETVQTLDLHRYMGKWFEIARFDHRFEHNLVGATVEYSFLPNGDIEVVNSGYWGNFSGSFKRAKGIAKITDPTCPSKLKVCFFMRFYAEYNIMEIDEDNYSYALVGSNTSDYLWLLSRTPTLPEEAILFLLTKAKERGYNTSMLKWVKQKHENQK